MTRISAHRSRSRLPEALGAHAANDILVYVGAEGVSNLRGDLHTIERAITPFQLDIWSTNALRNLSNVDGLTIPECLLDATGGDQVCVQSEHKAIEGGQVRGPSSGAIVDKTLVLEQQRFRGDGADAAGAPEFYDGNE